MITLGVEHLYHSYESVPVLTDLTFHIEHGMILGCIGRNGVGKSTLLRIIAGLQHPSAGSVVLHIDGHSYRSTGERRTHCGFCAPNLVLYEELTLDEHVTFHAACRGGSITLAHSLITQCELTQYRDTLVGKLSSGLKQRVKLVLAFMTRPALLVLDEPTTNLDSSGIAVLEQWIQTAREHAIIIIATNTPVELAWCSHFLDLEQRRFSHASSNACARADHE